MAYRISSATAYVQRGWEKRGQLQGHKGAIVVYGISSPTTPFVNIRVQWVSCQLPARKPSENMNDYNTTDPSSWLRLSRSYIELYVEKKMLGSKLIKRKGYLYNHVKTSIERTRHLKRHAS
ncbi:hypothetical protein PGTUg99_033490 [Puccinia graminis f. sp. tritici]|uniref:Uncharacterized protein n=1 Tax=Puccinia graminis f. sp. tritici TaxID=56615 RepID=A0A5B0LVY6_PUCGR|nr:hypothetical protein PGTUg99_033490 [Puccinia graminis f. sp. tritici]